MTEKTKEELEQHIQELQKEVDKLRHQIKRQKYGLVWLDVPEKFEEDSNNKIPILTEVKDKAIKNEDGKPTHVLIEGDNYHALTCLNYTHRGKVDVIYIDPPYNTGNDGFTYRDSRYMDTYPDGKPVPKDDPARHSTWLSFMSKRLKLAKNLLSDNGVIFISIDDNEQANLKLLCDEVFGEENFIGQCVRKRRDSQANLSHNISTIHEYVHIYIKRQGFILNKVSANLNMKDYKNPDNDFRGLYKTMPCTNRGGTKYQITTPTGKIIYDEWRFKKETYEQLQKENRLVFPKNGNGKPRYKLFLQEKQEDGQLANTWLDFLPSNQEATREIKDLFNGSISFNTPKPVGLLSYCIQLASSKDSLILDFFAGSGTTLHATMKLNEEDGGHRQCILVQQKEGENNICENVTYERNRKVMMGYTNTKGEKVEGLGNSLKYYKTDFVGKHTPANATDEDRVLLCQKAGYLLALAENTLEEMEKNSYFQLFSNGQHKLTAIYFSEDYSKIEQMKADIANREHKKTNIYMLSWGNASEFQGSFDELKKETEIKIDVKPIPQPILDIYKSIYK